MHSYWVRMIWGAAGVFVVGMAGWYLFGGAKEQVVGVIDSAVTLSIPLPFDLVPFRVDGARLGTLKKLVIHRDSPKEVNWIEIDAELNEAGQRAELAGCRLSIDDFQDLDANSSFVCNTELPKGYVEFGEIRLRQSGESLVLWVPGDVAADLRHPDRGRIKMEHARMYQRKARMAARTNTEVGAKVAAAISAAFSDSITAEVLAELEAAGGQADVHVAEIRTVDGEVRVEVKSADSAATKVEVGP